MPHHQNTKYPPLYRPTSSGPRLVQFAPEPVDAAWQLRGVCRNEDPELFFPIGSTGPAATQIEQARAVCLHCPVRRRCLQWALETGQEDGVWGGMSEAERRSLKRRAARSKGAAA